MAGFFSSEFWCEIHIVNFPHLPELTVDHLISLAASLRAVKCTNRIGLFLHIALRLPLIRAAISLQGWLMLASQASQCNAGLHYACDAQIK